MDCLEAQSKMLAFVKNELEEEETEAFLAHVDQCQECCEELQINYSVYEGIKMLDNDKLDSLNIQRAFEEYMQQTRERLVHSHRRKRIILIVLLVLGILLLVGLAVYSGIELPKIR